MIKVFFPILLVALVCFDVAFSTAWRDCGSTTGKVIKVEIEHCEKRHRCILTRGKNITLGITFESSKNPPFPPTFPTKKFIVQC